MDQEQIEKILVEQLRLQRENNALLKKMHQSQNRSKNFKIAYRIILIAGIAYGVYIAFPYIKTFIEAYKSVQQSVQEIKDTKNSLINISR